MNWVVKKLAVIMYEHDNRYQQAMGQAVERAQCENIIYVTTGDSLRGALEEAVACSKFVTVLCRSENADPVNMQLGFITSLTNDNNGGGSVGIVLTDAETEEKTPKSEASGAVVDGA